MAKTDNPPIVATANLFRRIAALVYDGLLLIAILFVASLLTLPFTGGKGSTSFNPGLLVYFLSVSFLFLGWFWTHGGQTLGMRAWRIRLVMTDLAPVSWKSALIRYLLSLPVWFFLIYSVLSHSQRIGIHTPLTQVPAWLLYSVGLAWLMFDHMPNNWREKLSRTKMIFSSRDPSESV